MGNRVRRKTRMVTFRCEEELFQDFAALAATKDKTMSELLRETVHSIVEKEAV